MATKATVLRLARLKQGIDRLGHLIRLSRADDAPLPEIGLKKTRKCGVAIKKFNNADVGWGDEDEYGADEDRSGKSKKR
ncbi:MAG: hypothetical protein J0H41_07645 [Rhizobiales bacterium]|nr:hypothetical protein [Hyphomicrobiales bacterium]